MACNSLSCLKQDGLTLMAEQAQALKLLFEGWDVFIWFPTGYGKSLCYISCYFLMDYKLGRTKAPPVDKSVVLVNCLSPCISHHETHD